MSGPACNTEGSACGLSLKTGVPAVVRMVLGGLFVLAAYTKLSDDRGAYDAVNAFHLGIGDQLTQILAKVVPWAELCSGVLLILGLWARGAAVLAIVLLAGFIGGIASVMARNLDVTCGCFGKLKMFCGDRPMGVCHLVRNSIMIGAALVVLIMGAGLPALDSLLCRKAGRGTP
ncbi:MAG: DoxX family protein [Phycisphaerales bacterium]